MTRKLFLVLFMTFLLGMSSAVWANALSDGIARLIETQNSDGGWGWPVTGGSAVNTIGPIGMGFTRAYQYTQTPEHLQALQLTGNFLLTKQNNFSPSDGYLANALDGIFTGTTYKDHLNTYFYGPLAAGNYFRQGDATPYSTQTYVNRIRTNRSGSQANMAAWDLGMGLVGAASCGVSGAELTIWIDAVKAEIDELDSNNYYDVIGLAGALYGLAYVNEEFDPTAGSHAGASSVADLAAILASYQINNGGFAWNSAYVIPNDGNETIQETSYALMALNEVNRALYLPNLIGGADYINSQQLANGGWENYPGSGENNEITAEALWSFDDATAPDPVYPVVNQTQGLYYTTIQAAISAANHGDIITVEPGTYTEALDVTKGISLISLGTTTETIINCPNGVLTTGIKIRPNLGTVVIDGFTVQGFTEGGIIQGMASATGTTAKIYNNIVISNGVYLRNGIQVTGNNSEVIGNIVYGAPLTDEWASTGILAVNGSGFIIQNNTVYSSDSGIGLLNYYGTTAMTGITITGNTLEGNDWSMEVSGWSFTPPATNYVFEDITITNNNYSNSTNAALGLYFCDIDGLTITGNTFAADNPIQFENSSENDLDIATLQTVNTFATAHVYDQIIYGNASAIYVYAPEALIKDSEEQTYAVKAINTENMRGATVRVTIPKVDFAEPNTFTMGANFDFMDIVESHTATEWVYDVTVSILGVGGITAANYDFFTWKMTSLANAQNLAGSLIILPYDDIVMYDQMNQPIICTNAVDATVIIDSGEPELEHDNATTYPSGMLLTVDAGGSGLLVRPTFELTITDDYNLDYAQYMIIPAGEDAPDEIAQFSLGMPVIDGTTTTGYTWQLPETVDDLADGPWTVYFLVVDDAGNFSIYDWDFEIDTTLPATPLWTSCLTTVDGANSVDLIWTGDAAKYDIWVLNYDDLTDAGGYPLYNPAAFGTPAIPAAPNAYNPDVQNGWTRLENDLVATSYTHNPGVRGYYYYYIFAEDLAGNYSPVSELRESISYWPGDVNATPDGFVTADDITLLGSVWGLTNASGSFVDTYDVGPSIGRLRRGRPTPDGRINIDDLMMFSMNYMNTNYTAYPRSTNDSKPDPVRIDIEQEILGNELIVRLILSENNGLVKGLNIPLEIGSGLELQSVTAGTIWNEESILLHTNEQGKVELSGSNLVDCIADNGLVATLSFKISGQNTELALKHMIARAFDNSDIEIIDNPQDAPSGDEDPEIIIPAASFLGANYPNPFNPTTTIGFGLNESGNVKISVFNSRGQLVRTLVNGTMQAGMHNVVWNGMDDSNRPLGSGIYFIKMQTRNLEQTTRAIMVK